MRKRDTDKQELVKEKALELLAADGLEGFSVNKLAKACDISVATLYIYYKHKDDLILSIGMEKAKKMTTAMLKDFDPEATFEAGLKQQWKNRSRYMLDNPEDAFFFEQIRSSTYQEKIFESILNDFKGAMKRFVQNAVRRKEISEMPLEVYWSVAFAPLYNLIRFHQEGRSLSGKKFRINEKIIWQTFELVVKALKK